MPQNREKFTFDRSKMEGCPQIFYI